MAIERYPITTREEWLARRLQDVTASDVGALAGVDEYKTPLRVYAEKLGIALGPVETGPMRRGRWLESAVLTAVQEERPDWQLRAAKVYLRDPELRLGATPDSFAIDPQREGTGNLQLKVVSRPAFEREWADERVPLKYQLQTLAEAMLAEVEWAAIAALVIDTYSAEIVIREVPRHTAAEERIRRMAVTFWLAIERGELPTPAFSHDYDLIKELYAKGGGPPLDLSGDERVALLCEEKLAWTRRRRNAEGALEAVDAELCAVLGDSELGEHPDYSISWKRAHRKAYSVPEADFRVLRVRRRKAKDGDDDAAAN